MASDANTVFPAASANAQHEPRPSIPAAQPSRHVRYSSDGAAEIDASTRPVLSIIPEQTSRPLSAPEPPVTSSNVGSVSTPISPSFRRRPTRAMTFRNLDNFSDYDVRPGWQPGSEPGIDTSKPDGGRETLAQLKAPSDITVVDFSQAQMSTTTLNNATLADFLAKPKAAGIKCRWINVNGLSWDVIQMLGNYKNLHRLAIEDLINTRNRTKADWYPTHTYMVLTLQKLVHFDYAKNRLGHDGDSSSSDDDDELGGSSTANRTSIRSGSTSRSRPGISRTIRDVLGGRKNRSATFDASGFLAPKSLESGQQDPRLVSRATTLRELADFAHINEFRTLQRYHASPNDARTEFMERHSALSSRGLAVAAEQVSIFVTDDNTVISFFELSAQDVEQPILKRLRLPDTSLRMSCDASMVAQAIMDAIIDLAIPVTVCYGDVIGDLELDVLTRPSVNHTKSLYITITEMNKVLSFINPVMNLINTLRDHKQDNVVMEDFQNPEKGVIISPTTFVYLADVLDHCVLLTESLEQIRSQAENMIDLIFNTISANQNESMKQLTVVTIIFLPLTFLTGYFGQNFDNFGDLQRGISFFWTIAAPVIFFTIVIMMWDMIVDYIKSLIQRHHILNLRKHRRRRQTKKEKERGN
ncbi:hypothetical protein F503_03353 [Ophiostoma piceae UAMH 11346]|uniref:Family metal ion transporter n=1 Tax=Ophiostoma piceae (strain UAMH 11346) TaxID=1262450 RepID=S3C4Z9_OPHP1|nr:hypothetical protein F503_03353 [Ophiostoma piceae UAMH 11346]